MNRTTGQREIETTCSKLPFHLLLCLFLGLKTSSRIPPPSTSKPSPGRVNSKGNFPGPFAELAGTSAATRKGIYSGTSGWSFGEGIAKLVSEIVSMCIGFIINVQLRINVTPNSLARGTRICVCACTLSWVLLS